jgi:hypothetical protein
MSPKAFFSRSQDNVKIVDSALHLSAKHLINAFTCSYDTGSGQITQNYEYSSGYIRTNDKIRYGYIEILCNIPENLGLNPCFWMHGNSGFKKDEIDIFEKELGVNNNTHLLQNVYGGGGTNDIQRDLIIKIDFDSSFCGPQKIFAVEWLPEEIHFYINGVVTASVKYTPNNNEVDHWNFFTCTDFRYAEPMEIMLSLAVNDSIANDSIPNQGFEILYIKSFKLVDGGDTNHWPNYFSMNDPYLFKVNKTLRLGGEGKSAVIPPQINYTAWAKDSIILLKGFVADSTFFSARVIHGESELYLNQANEE